jgi:hypothetical protein
METVGYVLKRAETASMWTENAKGPSAVHTNGCRVARA